MNIRLTSGSVRLTLAVLLLSTAVAMSVGDTAGPARPPAVTLAENGRPTATIIVSADAGDVLLDAVKDLHLYIKKMSGAELPIANSPEGRGNVILVGRMPAVDKLIPDLDRYDLGPDGIVVKSLPGTLILTGQSDGYIHEDLGWRRGPTDCGTPNAIYTLLESLGCRWYMPGDDGEVVPRTPTVTVSVDITGKPDLAGRWIGSSAALMIGKEVYADFLRWRVRNRASHNTYFHMHSLQTGLLSKEKYFPTHPEYFALVKGKRQADTMAHPCLSNPAVAETVSTEVIDIMAEYRPWMRAYALGQCDTGTGWCECEKCQALYGDKTSTFIFERGMSDKPVPNVANGYLKFVNAVAERAEKVNPDILLTYYALYYIPGFPQVNARDSVLPVMCSITPHNDAWRREVLKWEKIAKHLYYYTYMGFQLDFPKLRIVDDIRWCYRHKGIAIYLEHDTHSPINTVALYLAAKAMWDVEVDSASLLSKFYGEYYGPAAEPMRMFYETFDRVTEEASSQNDWVRAYPDSLTPQVARTCRGYITAALDLADRAVVRRRIESMLRYWRATELHVEAQQALARWRKDKTDENRGAAREALIRTIEYIGSVKHEFALTVRIGPLNRGLAELKRG